MEKPIAKYQIEDTFKITGRGIVFAGSILEGTISSEDSIEFEFNGENLVRKIKGIDGIRSSSPKPYTGILIECKNEVEINDLQAWSPKQTIAKIYAKS